MKKSVFFIFFIIIALNFIVAPTCAFAENETPKIAFVIDDFGQDRAGVEQMLNLDIPLTCAIIPFMEHSIDDMKMIIENGKEAILHMPMEADQYLPESWYGPKMIKNNYDSKQIKEVMQECIDSLPDIKGVNIHIGSGVSQNEKQMMAVMEVVKDNNLYFLDSRTSDKSVCNEVAKELKVDYQYRDVFLEKTKHAEYNHIVSQIQKAIDIAKSNGKAVIIGHVGPEGGEVTAKAIKDSIPSIKNANVEIVPLSQIVSINAYKQDK